MVADLDVFLTLKVRIRGDNGAGLLLRLDEEILIRQQVREPEGRIPTVLLAAEQVTLTTDPQVGPRHLEPVG